jgi:hypothetical protein
MRRQFTPPISAKRDDRELPAVQIPHFFGGVSGGSEFFFDRRLRDAFDQQVNYQTSRLNYLLSAYPESVPQAQSLRLYFQEFFERGETLRRIRLTLDLTQFLAHVTLNCDQINLHLIMRRPPPGFCKQGAKGENSMIKPLQGLCLLAIAAFSPSRPAVPKVDPPRQKRGLGGANRHFCSARV